MVGKIVKIWRGLLSAVFGTKVRESRSHALCLLLAPAHRLTRFFCVAQDSVRADDRALLEHVPRVEDQRLRPGPAGARGGGAQGILSHREGWGRRRGGVGWAREKERAGTGGGHKATRKGREQVFRTLPVGLTFRSEWSGAGWGAVGGGARRGAEQRGVGGGLEAS